MVVPLTMGLSCCVSQTPGRSGPGCCCAPSTVMNAERQSAQAVFALLMENPGVAMQADEIAVKIGLVNGRHGLAGMVAWPSRQCAEMGRTPPFRYESPPAPGETGSYWMDPETAQLFIAARERSLARQADVHPQS
jgi:hypothetical protein